MKSNSLIVPLVFLWIGFVCAISFMEAWLKFTAEGVTLNTGLAIGKVVFGALNKVELVLALSLSVIIALKKIKASWNILFFIALIILLFQTFYILPILSERINAFLAGKTPPNSNLHSYYVLLETIKVVSLIIYGLYESNQLNK